MVFYCLRPNQKIIDKTISQIEQFVRLDIDAEVIRFFRERM